MHLNIKTVLLRKNIKYVDLCSPIWQTTYIIRYTNIYVAVNVTHSKCLTMYNIVYINLYENVCKLLTLLVLQATCIFLTECLHVGVWGTHCQIVKSYSFISLSSSLIRAFRLNYWVRIKIAKRECMFPSAPTACQSCDWACGQHMWKAHLLLFPFPLMNILHQM